MVDVGNDPSFVRFVGELDGGFDLGKHRARFKVAILDEVGDFTRGGLVDGFLVREAVVDKDVRDSSDGNKDVGIY